ncbi:MAG: glycosyltransferase family 2 protein [Oscillospiraceae bacterium]|jgi:glycosyltransferase involved in cell wall biosynthesis|nr:glycosyltransferase family 2 protein [Oscillospiraceae bacterium]
MSELISIIMPSYNTGAQIGATIRSIQAQTYENWELIIVDDCSTDDTDAVVAAFADPRIRYFKNEKNSGAAISRNRGLREAKGTYIAFQDSDDLWEPDKLESQLAFMKEKGYAFTFTDYRIQYPDGKFSPYIYTGPRKVRKWQVYCYCYFSTITVLYDVRVVGLIQIEDIRKNNDYAMWFCAAEKTAMYRFPRCLSTYCKREESISSGSKVKLIKHHYIMYRKALGKAVLPSLFYTGLNLVCGVLKKLIYRTKAE